MSVHFYYACYAILCYLLGKNVRSKLILLGRSFMNMTLFLQYHLANAFI